MSKRQREPGGLVLLINPSEADMEIEENPRRKRRKKSKAKAKRRASKRSNPAPRSVAMAAPRRRRRSRSNPARKSSRRRSYRRNPALAPMKQIGAAALGGMAARSILFGTDKIPVSNPYANIAIKMAAPFVVGLGAGFAGMPTVSLGAFGYAAGNAIDGGIALYNTYKATQPAAQPKPGPQGLGSVRQFAPAVPGFGSVRRTGASVRAR